FEQSWPMLQTWPHTPQFFGSNDVLVHASPQSVAPGHVSPPGPVLLAALPPVPEPAPAPDVRSNWPPLWVAQPDHAEIAAATRIERLCGMDRAYFMAMRAS